jgi:hypothetical protein
MTSVRVGVLMGGISAEREVSLRTGEGVANALADRDYDVTRIVFGPGTRGVDELVREARIDVAFLALHGRGGEDGCVQGLLELLGIPYTGSRRARLGAGDGQAQVEGALPPAQRPDAPRTISCLGRSWPTSGRCTAASGSRSSSSRAAKARRWASPRPRTSRSSKARSRRIGARPLRARREVRPRDGGSRRRARRPRPRRDRGRPEERVLRLRVEVHPRRDRVHLSAATRIDARAWCHEPCRAGCPSARLQAPLGWISS